MVLALTRSASPVVGCGQTRDASSAMAAPSSPLSGGTVSKGAITPKRKRAQRVRAGSLVESLIRPRPVRATGARGELTLSDAGKSLNHHLLRDSGRRRRAADVPQE